MGVDHNFSYPLGGRPSLQIQTNYLFNSGLFILSLDHMPTGPGVWPAFWFTGPDWPNDGEIDVMEGIDNMTQNIITLHTGAGCYLQANDSLFFNGSWNGKVSKEYLDCWQYGKWSKQLLEKLCFMLEIKNRCFYAENKKSMF